MVDMPFLLQRPWRHLWYMPVSGCLVRNVCARPQDGEQILCACKPCLVSTLHCRSMAAEIKAASVYNDQCSGQSACPVRYDY